MATKKPATTKRTDKATSEAKAMEAPKELISFEEYTRKTKPPNGLVASFKYEAMKTEKGLSNRSEDEWKADFETQKKRTYNSFQ